MMTCCLFDSDVSSQEAFIPYGSGTSSQTNSSMRAQGMLQQAALHAAAADLISSQRVRFPLTCAPLQAQASRWMPTRTRFFLMRRTVTLAHRQVGH